MRKTFFLFLVFLSVIAFAQEEVSDSAVVESKDIKEPEYPLLQAKPGNWTIGTELDVLPYASGGYYVSLFYGVNHVRFRGVYAHSTVPSFFTNEGFENHDVWAGAFIVDYFFKENFEGWWVAAGYEYWENQIVSEGTTNRLFWNNNVMTFGGGYVWKFAGNFYLNPWGAAHILMTGLGPYDVGGKEFKPKVFVPEVSLKIGWHF